MCPRDTDPTRNAQGDDLLLGGFFDPRSTAVLARRGCFYILAGDGPEICLLQKQDNGRTTNWFKFIGTDELVKISANDTTAGYLISKLVAGSNISLVELNDGGNETLQINATYTVKTQKDGIDIVNPTTIINFIGDGVAVTDGGGGITNVTIEGLQTQKEGLLVEDPSFIYNFKGLGVLVVNTAPNEVEITIPGTISGESPFNEKFFRFTPRDARADGNASFMSFKNLSVADLSQGGISQLLITIPVINYQVGDDITLNLHFIVDNQGGPPNRDVFTQVLGALFQIGTDVDTLVDIIKTDIYTVPNQEGLTYLRQFVFTAAQLGNPLDGNYFLRIIFERDANDASDNYNRNLHFYAGRAFWA